MNQQPPHRNEPPHRSGPSYGGPAPNTAVMSLGDWLITWLVLLIPCVGIIMSFVWAFSSTGNLNRRNYCRAYLIISAAIIVLVFVVSILSSAALIALFEGF